MAVIPFPSVKQAAEAKALRSGARPHQAVHTHLGIEDLEALTTRDFFSRIQADAENGTAVMRAEDESLLAQYLAFHGMRLPRAVKAAQVLDVCNDLRWSFGEAVRCAARGERDVAVAFPLLNAERLAYVRAMGRQDTAAVRDLARVVFKAPAVDMFLY
ncbi:hypothetical protein [Hydrogenophaga sp.]|uniref:hypothetical protein n=1 Tax=Hydrogenophaga sp. TaxID=1904254 RepID=UPI002728C2EE|nr:hypothetical protein [Hydrogenophaga sp.]MDO9436372.1 hypothetical protein [Hydrogenophaga sp.]